ncbi:MULTISPECIES: RNA polymerase recycling motor HelD [unclassified Clostridium]|uniref:RNA polymerase recycling motor HelD n=1 Tax=unclassified Clostridium TaxID=2614128 RepID=UPI0025BD5A03|nr:MULTISPECIES: RNA polymerase recycling motor HelD [unclassified Clostridium]
MAIEKSELNLELKKFEEVRDWVIIEENKTSKKYKEYEEKISALKKSSGGSFSNDLILAERIFQFTEKNLNKYKEASKQPYFARIDFREKRYDTETFYIGKFGLNDELKNEEIVIDWRAPIANLYYSGTYGESHYISPEGIIEGELKLKRKFLVRDEKLIDAFDEGINEIILKSSVEGNELIDEFLKINLEQSISSKLKDVVATIQKEQNEIIRAYKNKAMIIQGSAGSGKTTVALHRLAYLVYTYNEVLEHEEILVVAPNEIFLDYISEVLPNLGVYTVTQSTFESLCASLINYKGRIYTKDKKLSYLMEDSDEEDKKYLTAVSKIKGSLSFKVILDRYIKYLERKDVEVDDIKIDGYVLYSAKEIKKLYIRDLKHLPIVKRKDEINRYFKQKLKDKLENVQNQIEDNYSFKIKDIKSKENLNDEEKRKIIIELYDERDKFIKELKQKGNKALKDFFNSWQNEKLISTYYNLYSNEEIFNEITDNKIPLKLVKYIVNSAEKNIRDKIIDSEDLPHIVYLKMALEGIHSKYIHVIVDEAQDYSYFEMLILKLLSKQNSLTIVGDLGQGIYSHKGIDSWEKLIATVFENDATYVSLTQSYRSTVEIIDFANIVLDKQELNLIPAKPVLRHGHKPKIIKIENTLDGINKIDKIVEEVEDINKKTVAIICKTYKQCTDVLKELKKQSNYQWSMVDENDSGIKGNRIIIPSYMTKGLEFDATIVYNCDKENYGENNLDKKLLYVNLTRALHREYIMYKKSLSKLL